MKIFIAHLEYHHGNQAMIHAATEEALHAQIMEFVREDLAGFDRYRPEMTDDEAIELFQGASESSYFVDEINVADAFTDMECETAQIVWEAMLERNGKQPDEHPFERTWENYGVYGMRQIARGMALSIEAQWRAVDEQQRDGWSFDWEVVPNALDLVEWDPENGTATLPEGAVQKAIDGLIERAPKSS